MLTKQNIFEITKFAAIKAIALLINRSFEPLGITAKTNLQGSCLHVLLESCQVPNQQATVNFIRKRMIQLEIGFIQSVKIYARQPGTDIAVWTQEFDLIIPISNNLLLSPCTILNKGEAEASCKLLPTNSTFNEVE